MTVMQENPNLNLYPYSAYNGYAVYTKRGPLIEQYLESLYAVLWKGLCEYPRTFAIRFDLHLSSRQGIDCYQPAELISRFFSKLKSEIALDLRKRANRGARVHHSELRYAWVKEYGEFGLPHYHVLILLNNDTYNTLGSPTPGGGIENMATRIISAWAEAHGLEEYDARSLVHFPERATYRLNFKQPSFETVFSELFYRVSYFAKADSKLYRDGMRAFGCSRI